MCFNSFKNHILTEGSYGISQNPDSKDYIIVFNKDEYFDVFTEYAKNAQDDILIKITIHNRGNDAAYIALLPTLWLRNLWTFGLMHEKPRIFLKDMYGIWIVWCCDIDS